MCFAQSVLNARRSVALLRKTQIGCIWGVGILVLPLASGGGGMADALVSGASDRKVVEVQLLSAAPPTSTDRDRRPKAVSSTAPAATSAIRSARRRPNRSAAEPISHGPMIEPPYPAAVTTIRAVPVRPRFAPALKASGTITAQ